MPLVSVVTPVFNGAEYLSECMESVLAQTFRHWEHIVVDNCSTDETLRIAKRYASGDERIRIVHHEEFVSALANANRGLRAISDESRYTKVLNADDFMFPRCLEEMVAVAERHPRVGIVGSYRLRDSGMLSVGLPYDTEVVPGRDAGRMNLTDGPYTLGSPSAHLFRSEIVRSRTPFYEENHISGDVEADLYVLKEWDLGFVHQVLVYSREQEGSITASHASLRAQMAAGLDLLRTFGPTFLTEAELRDVTRRTLRNYYRTLGADLVRGNLPEGYWAHHRHALERFGLRLSPLRVAAGAAFAILRSIARRAPA